MSFPPLAELASVFKGDLITPDHPDYKASLYRWAPNAERNAKVVAFVKDNEDVVAALRFAEEYKIPIAVRGGGHSVSAASSIEDGLVIDLSRFLNYATVDPEKRIAYVGGGSVWSTVDVAGMKHGLATVGGTINHTGVAGLILGGGYGWLSGAYGLSLDTLLKATIITANGSILSVSDEDNADLFWAIRGAGGNFGVVTEFVLQLYPQRATIYAGPVFYKPDDLPKLVEETKKWWQTAGDRDSMVLVNTVKPDNTPVVAIIPFFNGTELEGRERFKSLLDIGPALDMSKDIPYEQMNGLQNGIVGHGRAVYMKGVAFNKLNQSNVVKAYKFLLDLAAQGTFQGEILYEHYPLHKVNSVPNHATAFRREASSNALLIITWDKSQNRQAEARKLVYELGAIVTEGQTYATSTESRGYTNYDSDGAILDKSDKAALAFGDNYPRLQGIKKRYDPQNIFNLWFPITPA